MQPDSATSRPAAGEAVPELAQLTVRAAAATPVSEDEAGRQPLEQCRQALFAWSDALQAAKAAMGINAPFVCSIGRGKEILIEVDDSQASNCPAYDIYIGVDLLKMPTSQNLREVAMLHELAHYTIEWWLKLGANVLVGLPLFLAYHCSTRVKERAANRLTLEVLARGHGRAAAIERMRAGHRERLAGIYGPDGIDQKLLEYCKKYSPELL